MSPSIQQLNLVRLGQTAIVAGAVAAVGNLLVFWIAGGTAVPLNIPGPQGTMPLTAVPVIAASFIPAVLAAGFLWVLARFTKTPIRTFQMVAAGLALLSLIGPLALGVAASTKAVLALMHIVAAVSIVTVLSRAAR